MKEIPTISFQNTILLSKEKRRIQERNTRTSSPSLVSVVLSALASAPNGRHHQAVAILGLTGEGVPPRRKEHNKKKSPHLAG